MAKTSSPQDSEHESTAGVLDRLSSRRIGGVAFILGAVTLVATSPVGQRVAFPTIYIGPAGLITILENPIWRLSRTLGVVGLLLVAMGVIVLLHGVSARGEWNLAMTSGGTLVISISLFLVEFVIAVLATVNILGGTGSIGLTQREVEIILMGYQALGVGLLVIATIFLGVSLIVLGVGIYRTRLYSSWLAAAGIIIGTLVILSPILAIQNEMRFPEPFSPILAGLWFLAAGVSLLRADPTPKGM